MPFNPLKIILLNLCRCYFLPEKKAACHWKVIKRAAFEGGRHTPASCILIQSLNAVVNHVWMHHKIDSGPS